MSKLNDAILARNWPLYPPPRAQRIPLWQPIGRRSPHNLLMSYLLRLNDWVLPRVTHSTKYL